MIPSTSAAASASNWTQLVAVQTLTARPAAWPPEHVDPGSLVEKTGVGRPGQSTSGDAFRGRIASQIVPARDLEAGLEVVPHQRCRGVVGDLAQRRDRPLAKKDEEQFAVEGDTIGDDALDENGRHASRRSSRSAGESDSPTRRSDRPGFFSSTLRPTVLGTASSTSASVGTAASVPAPASLEAPRAASPRRSPGVGQWPAVTDPPGRSSWITTGVPQAAGWTSISSIAVSSRSAARVTASIVFSVRRRRSCGER